MVPLASSGSMRVSDKTLRQQIYIICVIWSLHWTRAILADLSQDVPSISYFSNLVHDSLDLLLWPPQLSQKFYISISLKHQVHNLVKWWQEEAVFLLILNICETVFLEDWRAIFFCLWHVYSFLRVDKFTEWKTTRVLWTGACFIMDSEH